MAADDFLAGRQAEAAPLLLGGVERGEDPLPLLRADARPVIGDLDDDPGDRLAARIMQVVVRARLPLIRERP